MANVQHNWSVGDEHCCARNPALAPLAASQHV